MEDISARLSTIRRNPKKLQMTRLVSKDSSTSAGGCNGVCAVSGVALATGGALKEANRVRSHWNKHEAHHHSQTEA
jgi:hypothetical protein